MRGRDSIPTAQVGEIKRGVCGVFGGRYGAFGDEFGERVKLQSRSNSRDAQACSGPPFVRVIELAVRRVAEQWFYCRVLSRTQRGRAAGRV